MSDYSVIGKRVHRVDAADKVTGRAQYTSDLHLPGMLYGVFLRSPYAHAKIKKIDTRKAERLPGVRAIITQASLGQDQVLIVEEEVHATRRVLKLFADDKVRYQGEKVAAIAADTKAIADEAASLIKVDYEPLPAVVDVREAIKPGAPLIFEDVEPVKGPTGELLYNIAGEMHKEEGNVEQGFRESDYIYEDTYVIPRAHQTYIEPQVAIAQWDATGKVTIWTSTQGHFAIRSNISNSLRIPLSKINVVGMTIGGGFGAKFGGIIDTYTVLLAQKAARPVKMVYSREEEFMDGRPAPGCVITIKTGVKKDGTIIARYAYALWDPGVGSGGSWATGRIRGVYNIPNYKFDSYEVHTNKSAPGAYRAPGAPQATFASEAQIDKIAHDLSVDPVEIRLKNMKEGPEWGFKETLKKVSDHVGWASREKGADEGWGVAIGEWTNGSGPGSAVVSVHEDGSVKIFSGLMDITGTDTAMAQIAAEVLSVPYEEVTVVRGDTDSAPFATASGGSVVTFSMGNAVKRAAEDAKAKVLQLAAEHLEANVADLELKDKKVQVKGNPESSVSLAELGQASLRSTNGPIVGRGSFASEPSATTIAAQIAKVRVDRETGEVKLLKFAGSLDAGKAINPMAVEGQMEGGAVQGLSWGLMEQIQFSPDGRVMNPNLLDYRIPTSLDMPDLDSLIVEVPTDHGPFGVKGLGEPPITPGIAVIANAVADATGVWIKEAPLTSERVYMALHKGNGK